MSKEQFQPPEPFAFTDHEKLWNRMSDQRLKAMLGDGKELALVTLDRGGYRIAVMELDSRNLRVLTDARQDESPSFAPNGAMLIYATRDRGRGSLAIASSDGRFKQRLSSDQGDVREPAWSPFVRP